MNFNMAHVVIVILLIISVTLFANRYYKYSPLGDKITLQLLQIKAKQNGFYCYEDNGDSYCILSVPKVDKIRGR